MTPPQTTTRALLDRYPALLFDAFGVLVDDEGALPGAPELIALLNREHRPYCILTNSASRLPEENAALFASLGLDIPPERIVSAGLLLTTHFAQQGLAGARCVVLGPQGSRTFAQRAGAQLVAPAAGMEAEVVVIADEKGYPLLDHFDHVLSLLLRRIDTGRVPHLVVCNPDLIYPRGPGAFGLTAGGLALLLEGILAERYGPAAPRFLRLGKPFAPIFEEALRRVGTREAVMIGDQPATDIRGANGVGIDSALVASGLCRRDANLEGGQRPTWLLPSLRLNP